MWESDAVQIQSKAAELINGQPNFYYKIERIFEFVKDWVEYDDEVPEDRSALWTFQNKRGDCTQFTYLFIALCRAADIPARFVACDMYDPPKPLERSGHAFALVYMPNVGWMPVDLTVEEVSFGEISYEYLIKMSIDGNVRLDSSWWSRPGPAEVDLALHGSIDPEVALDVAFGGMSWIDRDMLKIPITFTNIGTQTVRATKAELKIIENELTVATTTVEMDKQLTPDSIGTVNFSVKITETIENPKLVAEITYSSTYGEFLAEGRIVSTTLTPGQPVRELLDIVLIALCMVLVALIAVLAWTLVRR